MRNIKATKGRDNYMKKLYLILLICGYFHVLNSQVCSKVNVRSYPKKEVFDSVEVEFSGIGGPRFLTVVYNRNRIVCFNNTLEHTSSGISPAVWKREFVHLTNIQSDFLHTATNNLFVSKKVPMFLKRKKIKLAYESDYVELFITNFCMGNKSKPQHFFIGDYFSIKPVIALNEIHQYSKLFRMYLQLLEKIDAYFMGGEALYFYNEKIKRIEETEHSNAIDVSDSALKKWLCKYQRNPLAELNIE